MATERDPVCGMDVDPATSELSLEHDGTTYWFCSRGCLLEFRDDPETYLAPDFVPSMKLLACDPGPDRTIGWYVGAM